MEPKRMSGEPIASASKVLAAQFAEVIAADRPKGPKLTPRAAATLILLDRSGPVTKVLFGRRHAGHKFLPGKFVFPGGRIEAGDFLMPAINELPDATAEKLGKRGGGKPIKPRSLALAALRETFEETGLILGGKAAVPANRRVPRGWEGFVEQGFLPDLTMLQFIGRAITPPGRTKRFDSRFFAADAAHIAHRIEGVVTENSELVELVWCPVAEAVGLGIPNITAVILQELDKRIAAGFSQELPVPFYHARGKRRYREEI
jgi:8-oxo-dGTP pyrophosphatase MutT (NUDIX family)